jgi:hypothetical protein
VLAVGCSQAEEIESNESRVTATSTAPSGESGSFAACAGFKPCSDAFVLRALFNSQLILTGPFIKALADDIGFEDTDRLPATQVLTEGLAQSEVPTSVLISAREAGRSHIRAKIILWNIPPAGMDAEGHCKFAFTIENSAIVERSVDMVCENERPPPNWMDD